MKARARTHCSDRDHVRRRHRRSRLAAIADRPIATCMADWLTDGGDPQRTAWQKDEHILNVSNVKGMKLLWKYKTDNQPREMHALFPPLIVGRVLTAAGPKQVAVVAGVSDNIYAIDVATGGLLWKHHFDTTFSPPPGVSFGTLCPGGQLATPVIGPGRLRAVTSSMRPHGTDAFISSTSRPGKRSRRRNCSCRPTPSRTRSTCGTASSTRRARRDAAAIRITSMRSTSPRGGRRRSIRAAAGCGGVPVHRSAEMELFIPARATGPTTPSSARMARRSSP